MKSLSDILEAELDKKQIIIQILQTDDIDDSTINKIYKLVSPMDNFEPKVEQGLIKLGIPRKSVTEIIHKCVVNDDDFAAIAYLLDPNDRMNPWYGLVGDNVPRKITMNDLVAGTDIYEVLKFTKVSRQTLVNISTLSDNKGVNIGKGEILLWIFGLNAKKSTEGDISISTDAKKSTEGDIFPKGNTIEVKSDNAHAIGLKDTFKSMKPEAVYAAAQAYAEANGYNFNPSPKPGMHDNSINNSSFRGYNRLTNTLTYMKSVKGNDYDPIGFIKTCMGAGVDTISGLSVKPSKLFSDIFDTKYGSKLNSKSAPSDIANATIDAYGIFCLYVYLKLEKVDYFMLFQGTRKAKGETDDTPLTGNYRLLDANTFGNIKALCKYDGISYKNKLVCISNNAWDYTPEMVYKS